MSTGSVLTQQHQQHELRAQARCALPNAREAGDRAKTVSHWYGHTRLAMHSSIDEILLSKAWRTVRASRRNPLSILDFSAKLMSISGIES
mmetsp:Transcript_10150/g.17807  ORF Transcript_10150/g.17807 Transcript_10150/m.17807 type:complete len:90 (-) Transcript_10150:149-418(-)